MPRIGGEVFGLFGVDDAMEHERIERKQRSAEHDIAIGLLVAIGHPLLAPGTLAGEVMIFARAEDCVGIAQPERRWPGPGGQVDEDLGIGLAQAFNEMNGGGKIAVEDAAGEDLARIPRTIDLELIHAITGDEVQAGFFKFRIVARA